MFTKTATNSKKWLLDANYWIIIVEQRGGIVASTPLTLEPYEFKMAFV